MGIRVYFKRLAHVIVGLAGQTPTGKTRNLGRLDIAVPVLRQLEVELLLKGGISVFSLHAVSCLDEAQSHYEG